ncbi:MAG: N-6 DNA methylase [Planctomycetota bacterium]|jgi:methylase of polypeptide subunit release factors
MNLAAAWEISSTAHAERHSHGGVFTPREIALRLAHETLSRWQSEQAPDILDPACGHGALLLAAVEWAKEHRPHWLKYWAQGGLKGWELHEDVANQCREALRLALGDCEIIVRDSLLADDRECADVVLANPPWISFSGRHAQEISAKRKSELAARFGSFSGWPALHTAFAELCVLLTRQDGVTGVLVPQQMADLDGYAKCREVIASLSTLVDAQELGEGLFADVTEPTGLFVFKKTPTQESGPWWAHEHPDWLQQALRFPTLPAECFRDPGVHSGNSAKLLITGKPEENAEPIYVGRDINPFVLSKPSHWMRQTPLPEGHYFRTSKLELYENADILIRQTASRPIAARHDPKHLFRNSVLACYVPDEHNIDFVLGVLNSDVMARIHQALHRDGRQKAFPQMKVSHLRSLPTPGREIGDVYDKITNLSRDVQQGQDDQRGPLNELIGSIFK